MVFSSNASTCVSACASEVIIQTKQRGKCQNERQQRLLREGGVSCQVWLPQFAQSSFSNSDQGARAPPRTMHTCNLLHSRWGGWWRPAFLTIPVCRHTNLFLLNYLCQKKMNRFGGGSTAPILYIKNAVCSCELQSNRIAHIFSSWLFRFQSKIGHYNIIFKWKELEGNCTNKMFTKSASWILHIFFSPIFKTGIDRS